MKNRDGGPAFPAVPKGEMGVGGGDGMTLRDYFAGQALTGMLANPGLFGDDMLGKDAYAIADAMLAERNAYDENYFDACRLCGDRVYIPHLKNHQCPEPQP